MLKPLRITVVLLASGILAHAVPLKWYLSGVRMDDGATANGSFVYDAATNTYSAIDITTSGGSKFAGTHYTAVVPTQVGLLNAVFLLSTPNPGAANFTGTPVLPLFFGSPLTNSGGVSNLTTGVVSSYETTCVDAACNGPGPVQRIFVSGTVTTTASQTAGAPALSEWALILLAIGIAVIASHYLHVRTVRETQLPDNSAS